MTNDRNYLAGKSDQLPGQHVTLANYRARHIGFDVVDQVATITLNRPERKNPLTFDSYAELCQLFLQLAYADDVKAVVLTGAGENFCSGGDVFEIIGPLTEFDMPSLLRFTRMTGDLVKAIRACPQPVIAAIDGVCAGAGAILAMAADIRRHRAQQDCVLVYPCRSGWLRYGCLCDSAAHHRPGSCRRFVV